MSEEPHYGPDIAMTRTRNIITSPGGVAIHFANSLIDLLDEELTTQQKLFLERVFRFDPKLYMEERVELYQLISLMKSFPGQWRVVATQEERDFTPSDPPLRRTLVKAFLATEGEGYTKQTATGHFSFGLEGGCDVYYATVLHWKISNTEGTIKIRNPGTHMQFEGQQKQIEVEN